MRRLPLYLPLLALAAPLALGQQYTPNTTQTLGSPGDAISLRTVPIDPNLAFDVQQGYCLIYNGTSKQWEAQLCTAAAGNDPYAIHDNITTVQSLEGPLTLSDGSTAASQTFVNNAIAAATSGLVKRSGDTMTGSLISAHDPTVALEFANKEYVDSKVSGVTVTLPAGIVFGNGISSSATVATPAQVTQSVYNDTRRGVYDLLNPTYGYNSTAGADNSAALIAITQAAGCDVYEGRVSSATILLPPWQTISLQPGKVWVYSHTHLTTAGGGSMAGTTLQSIGPATGVLLKTDDLAPTVTCTKTGGGTEVVQLAGTDVEIDHVSLGGQGPTNQTDIGLRAYGSHDHVHDLTVQQFGGAGVILGNQDSLFENSYVNNVGMYWFDNGGHTVPATCSGAGIDDASTAQGTGSFQCAEAAVIVDGLDDRIHNVEMGTGEGQINGTTEGPEFPNVFGLITGGGDTQADANLIERNGVGWYNASQATRGYGNRSELNLGPALVDGGAGGIFSGNQFLGNCTATTTSTGGAATPCDDVRVINTQGAAAYTANQIGPMAGFNSSYYRSGFYDTVVTGGTPNLYDSSNQVTGATYRVINTATNGSSMQPIRGNAPINITGLNAGVHAANGTPSALNLSSGVENYIVSGGTDTELYSITGVSGGMHFNITADGPLTLYPSASLQTCFGQTELYNSSNTTLTFEVYTGGTIDPNFPPTAVQEDCYSGVNPFEYLNGYNQGSNALTYPDVVGVFGGVSAQQVPAPPPLSETDGGNPAGSVTYEGAYQVGTQYAWTPPLTVAVNPTNGVGAYLNIFDAGNYYGAQRFLLYRTASTTLSTCLIAEGNPGTMAYPNDTGLPCITDSSAPTLAQAQAAVNTTGTIRADFGLNIAGNFGTTGQCLVSGGGAVPDSWGTCGTGSTSGVASVAVNGGSAQTGAVSLTIPAAQVNSDWNASSGVAQILNKPTLLVAPAAGVVKSNGTSLLDAGALDIVSLFASGSCSGFLRSDGTCGSLNQTGNPIGAQTVTGTINGTNTVFTLPYAPAPASTLELYQNGLLQIQGTNYTVSGSTVTFTTAPAAGDTLTAYMQGGWTGGSGGSTISGGIAGDIVSVGTSGSGIVDSGIKPVQPAAAQPNSVITAINKDGSVALTTISTDFLTDGYSLEHYATAANLPASQAAVGQYWLVVDGANPSDCSTGGGTTPVLCKALGANPWWQAEAVGGVTWAGDLAGSSNTTQTVVAVRGEPWSATAPTTGQSIAWNGTQWAPTSAAASTATQVGVLAHHDLGLDYTGSNDVGATLQTVLSQTSKCSGTTAFNDSAPNCVPAMVHFEPGVYKLTTMPHLTSGAWGDVVFDCEGTGSVYGGGRVIFEVETGAGNDGMWFDANPASWHAPEFRGCTFVDGTNYNAVTGAYTAGTSSIRSLLHYSNINMIKGMNNTFSYAVGSTFNPNSVNAGTLPTSGYSCTLTNSSYVVTCAVPTGTSATTVGYFTQGIFWATDTTKGRAYPQEIYRASLSGTTLTLTLATPYQHNSGTSYSWYIVYGGKGLLIDGFGALRTANGNTGTLAGFSQYGSMFNTNAYCTTYPLFLSGGGAQGYLSGGSVNNGSGGTQSTSMYGNSRFKFFGGWFMGACPANGAQAPNGRLANSIAEWVGGFNDTMELDIDENDYAIGTVIENGHQNTVGGKFEGAGTQAEIYGCSGTAPAQACTTGVLLSAAVDQNGTSHGNDNRVNAYVLSYGNPIELLGNADHSVLFPQISPYTNTNDITFPAIGDPACSSATACKSLQRTTLGTMGQNSEYRHEVVTPPTVGAACAPVYQVEYGTDGHTYTCSSGAVWVQN